MSMENFCQILRARQHMDSDASIAITGEEGCLVGETIINTNRNEKGVSYEIEYMYNQFHKIKKGVKSHKLWNLKNPTYVRSFDGHFIKLHKIKDVVYSGEKEVFKMVLEDDSSLTATSNHKILTQNGFIELLKLDKEKDKVMCDTLHSTPRGKMQHKFHDIQIGGLRYHPYAKLPGQGGGKSRRLEIHRIIYEANLNGLDLRDFIEVVSDDEEKSKTLKYINPQIFSIHHKDGNHYNNEIKNLDCISIEEHLKLHGMIAYENFNQGIGLYKKIVSIELIGVKKVYDILCEDPYHNFVANGMVVHNSGKTTAAIQVGKQIDKKHFNIAQSMIYTTDHKEIQAKIEDPKISVLIIDEAIKNFYKLNFQDRKQKYLNQVWTLCRKENKITVLCIPRFRDLNEYFRNHRIKYWVHILTRGIAVVLIKDDSAFVQDPWYMDLNQKIWDTYRGNKKIAELTLKDKAKIYSRTKNYLCLIQFDDLAPDEKTEYLTIVGSKKYEGLDPQDKPKELSFIEKKYRDKLKNLCFREFNVGKTKAFIHHHYQLPNTTVQDWYSEWQGLTPVR